MNYLEEEWSDLSCDSEPDTMIKAWSHSRDANFRKCKFRAKLLYMDKQVEPRPPLREGQTEYANDRGSRIHEAAELYVKGGVELLPELHKFADEYQRLRELYAAGRVSLEGDWGFDSAWLPVDFFSADVWLRVKIDALVHMSDEHAVVIDYKSGRKSGNELKHAEQTQLYCVSTFMRYPKLKRITTELWYLDVDDLTCTEYTREQGMRFFKIWNDRGCEITSCTEFPPSPNKYNCQYCYFGKKGNGICEVGL